MPPCLSPSAPLGPNIMFWKAFVLETRSSPAPSTKPPMIPPGANPKVPSVAPIAPALAASGSLSVINLESLGGRIPFLTRLSFSSNLPNSASDRVSEFLRIILPAPMAIPPTRPNPDPVRAAPASAPSAPPAATLGRSALAAFTTSFPVFLIFLYTSESPKI